MLQSALTLLALDRLVALALMARSRSALVG